MKNTPEKIYLQIGAEGVPVEDYNDLSTLDITWCVDRINEDDIEYKLSKQGERKFSLKEALEIAKDYYSFGVDAAMDLDCGHAPNSPTHTQYFKDKFGIEI